MHVSRRLRASARISVWPGKRNPGRVQRFLVNRARWRWHSPLGQRGINCRRHVLICGSTTGRRDFPGTTESASGDSPAGPDETPLWKRPARVAAQTRSSTPAIAEDDGVAHGPHALVGEKLQAQLGANPGGVAHRDRDTRQSHAIILRGLRRVAWPTRGGRHFALLELVVAKTCKNEREKCEGHKAQGAVGMSLTGSWKVLLGLMLLVSGD